MEADVAAELRELGWIVQRKNTAFTIPTASAPT
jgi:hypothetical protein